jgi:alpha-L-rhamnosidase
MRYALALAAFFFITTADASAQNAPQAVYLRCEYKVDPLGIDITAPRLSWEMQDERRGAKQTAYQILVADDPEKIAAGEGDLWDSGKVESSQTAQIVYVGRPLESQRQCYWKIRLWDHEGKPSAWSKPAFWTMGLLKPEDYRGKWIAFGPSEDNKPPAIALDDCHWVWYPDIKDPKANTLGRRFFRGKATVSPAKKIKSAFFVYAANGHAELIINGRYVSATDGAGAARCFDIADFLEPGENSIAVFVENGGSPNPPVGLSGKLAVEYDDGTSATFRIDGSWKASDRDFKGDDIREWLQTNTTWKEWLKPNYDDSSWASAVVGEPVVEKQQLVYHPPRGCPLLRKEFTVEKPIRRATLYIAGLGNARMRLNGQAVGKDYFCSGWTDFNKRVYYFTYDVTRHIEQGPNALGCILGPAWYAGPISTIPGGGIYGPYPRLYAQLEIESTDGTRTTIASDDSWKTIAGPFVQGENYAGEIYDSTREIPGWDRPGLDDSKWRAVLSGENNPNILHAFPGASIQEVGTIKPLRMTEPKPGRYVFDFGQNFGGVVRLKVKGPRGTNVEIRTAERLNPDGTVYTVNLRNARCIDKYTLRGEGEETYQPQFTFRSFQYAEWRFSGEAGSFSKPTLDDIEGVVLSAATPPAGKFECSSALLNRLFENILYTQRANYLSVPTDCPNREERLGWMGDAQVFTRTATYNADMAAFYTKWLVDIDDAQFPDGAFSNVTPTYCDRECGAAGWSDAGVICPCTVFWVYGDRRLLEEHYPAMTRWIEYCRARSDHLLRPNVGWGDWLGADTATALDVMGTAFFAESTKLTAQAAAVLGRDDDAKKYFELFEQIKTAFNKAYVAEDGRIKGDTQTGYLFALDFELLPPEKRPLAVNHLVEDIKKRGTLSCGIMGTNRLIPVLCRFGQTPLAYELLLSEKNPSWGYMIKNGATSIWERWDSWTPDKGFQNPVMNSFSHPALGAVGQALFQHVAGIDAAEPGFQKILIQPEPGEGVDWVKAGYHSMHGEILSAWKKENGKLTLDITIPANTTAVAKLPLKFDKTATAAETLVTESGKALKESPNVKILETEGSTLKIQLDAGRYRFEMPWK